MSDEQTREDCKHADSLYGRCIDCGKTWAQQAEDAPTITPPRPPFLSDTRVPPPKWAESWAKGTCCCGARLVNVECYCGGHVACSASGWGIGQCNRRRLSPPAGTETKE